jgi:hypothetical protein
VVVQRGRADGGQQGHAVLAPLAVAHGDLAAFEVDVLDPEAGAFEESQPEP